MGKICQYLKKLPFKSELIIVDDGSTDQTPQLLKKLSQYHSFATITLPKNRGKGYAIKKGMNAAKGQWHLFCDVDLSVPLATLSEITKHLSGADVFIGSRSFVKSSILKHQPLARELLGKVFTRFTQVWVDSHVSDFTCGFKCFSKAASQRIFSQLHVERWGFDAEIIFVAQLCGYSIKEIPVNWKNDEHTKVKLPQDLLRSILDLLELRYHHWRGRYG